MEIEVNFKVEVEKPEDLVRHIQHAVCGINNGVKHGYFTGDKDATAIGTWKVTK